MSDLLPVLFRFQLYHYSFKYFKENGVKTIPTAKRIQDEIEELTSTKNAGYTEYRESQKHEKSCRPSRPTSKKCSGCRSRSMKRCV